MIGSPVSCSFVGGQPCTEESALDLFETEWKNRINIALTRNRFVAYDCKNENSDSQDKAPQIQYGGQDQKDQTHEF